MTEVETNRNDFEERSRRNRRGGGHRRRNLNIEPLNEEFRKSLPTVRFLPVLLWSAILSVLSVANPLLTGLASNLQSQNIYAGLAMDAGQKPYADFFGTNGVLYYLLAFVSGMLKTTIGLAFFQFIALSIAGIYFYKIVAYFSKYQDIADQLLVWFYLFLLAAGFGGLYASIFALPFVLTSIWFLLRYFKNGVRDEMFILYGIDAALVFMIYPKSLLLWVIAAPVLLVFTIRQRRLARGVYQGLATLFGFLLIIYSVGYYTFIEQILGLAIQQTFLFNLDLDFGHANILWTLAIVVGALLVSGFLKNFWMTLMSFKDSQHRYIKSTIVIAFLAELLFTIGNPNFDISQLILLLPYGLIMAVMPLHQSTTEHLDENEQASPTFNYLTSSFFLPLLVCLYIPLSPVLAYLQEGQLHQERTAIATYIREHSEPSAKIYAWDNSAQLYLRSQRLSAASILTPAPYLTTEENRSQMTYDLNKNDAEFIVINQHIDLLDSVKNTVERNYSPLDLGTKDLVLYQKNK